MFTNYSDEYTPDPKVKKRAEYIRKLIAKGCSERKAFSVAWRRFR